MRADAVWSQDYSAYVSPSFNPDAIPIKIAINLCDIIITDLGFYELWNNDKRIKKLTFNQYLKYKSHVKNVIGLEYLQ